MCSTPHFILRSAEWHIIGLLYEVESWKKRSSTVQISYQKSTVVAPDFRIKIIWIIFILKCRKGIFCGLLFSCTQTLNARGKCIVLHPNNPLKVGTASAFSKSRNPPPTTQNSKNFQDLQKNKMGCDRDWGRQDFQVFLCSLRSSNT